MGDRDMNGGAPKPAKTRMAAMRDRKRKAGMTPMEVWAHPDDHQTIREYAAMLAKARDQAANAPAKGPGGSLPGPA
jgi:hypothetical protein